MTVPIGLAGLNIFLSGTWLGLGAAAPVGPVNVEIARRTLSNGFWAGFFLGCGAVSADLTYAVLTSLSLGPVVNRPALKWPLAAAGLAFLAYLGVQNLRSAARHARVDPLAASAPGGAARRHAGGYAAGLFMTLLNPFTLVFWFIAVPAAGAITKDPRHDLPMICAGVFAGTISWVVFFCGVLACLGRYRRPWWLVVADGLGGVMLLGLAVSLAWRLARR